MSWLTYITSACWERERTCVEVTGVCPSPLCLLHLSEAVIGAVRHTEKDRTHTHKDACTLLSLSLYPRGLKQERLEEWVHCTPYQLWDRDGSTGQGRKRQKWRNSSRQKQNTQETEAQREKEVRTGTMQGRFDCTDSGLCMGWREMEEWHECVNVGDREAESECVSEREITQLQWWQSRWVWFYVIEQQSSGHRISTVITAALKNQQGCFLLLVNSLFKAQFKKHAFITFKLRSKLQTYLLT